MRTLLLSLALVAAAPALAQTDTLTVVPGSDALVTDWIAPGTTSYTLRVVQPMQQEVGTAVETFVIEDGTLVRTTDLSVPMQGMEQRDSLRADAATLAPRLHRSAGGPAEISLEFMDEGVAGTATLPGQETQTIMEMTDTPVFDGGWLGEIAQSLPYEEGLVAKVPVFSVQGGVTDAVMSVTGQEEIEHGGETRTGWTVEIALGPQTITQVIDAETRDLLVMRMSPQPGVVLEMTPTE